MPLIKKSSGVMELFVPEKLKQSLLRSGATEALSNAIVKDVESWIVDGISSKSIYDRAFSMLRKKTLDVASRYKLKKAIMELGPTGHPFEHFIGQVYKLQGFEVEVAQTLPGHCITHEIDVIATKANKQYLIECKFHQDLGKNANVQVPLYVRSRVDDIVRMRKVNTKFLGYTFIGGVVTNTRFTLDAETYGKCCGLEMLSWDYPSGNSLKDIVDRYRIYPVTALTLLTNQAKQLLMEQGVVICRQILEDPHTLDILALDPRKKQRILDEVSALSA
ncbi:MAG: restriction endonuclease [Clostridia bacterium]|nr:restriction endonuclease [Clostridia bacterium]